MKAGGAASSAMSSMMPLMQEMTQDSMQISLLEGVEDLEKSLASGVKNAASPS
jgi:hypothetical protein